MRQNRLNLEKRSEIRRTLELGELGPVCISQGNRQVVGHAFDLSANGVGVVLPAPLPFDGSQPLNIKLTAGCAPIVGVLSYQSQITGDHEKRVKVGISFCQQARVAVLREGRRYALDDPEDPVVQLFFQHPRFYDQHICARLIDISRQGLAFTIPAQNMAVLTPSMTISGHIILPTGGDLEIRFEVRHVRYDSSLQIFGCQILEASSAFAREMAEYLLAYSQQPTISQLEAEGFEVVNTSRALRFDYAKPHDYQEILRLRQAIAYFNGLAPYEMELADFSSPFDQQSRHVCAFAGSRVIAAASLCGLAGFTDSCSELQAQKIPLPGFLQKSSILEVSEIDIDPDYFIPDVFFNLLRQIILLSIQKNISHIILSANDDQSRMLMDVGGIPLGIRYYPRERHGEALNVIVLAAQRLLLGDGITPFQWSAFAQPLAEFLMQNQQLQPNFWDRLRLRAYRFLCRPSRWLQRENSLSRLENPRRDRYRFPSNS
jgi:hypothetical protein